MNVKRMRDGLYMKILERLNKIPPFKNTIKLDEGKATSKD